MPFLENIISTSGYADRLVRTCRFLTSNLTKIRRLHPPRIRLQNQLDKPSSIAFCKGKRTHTRQAWRGTSRVVNWENCKHVHTDLDVVGECANCTAGSVIRLAPREHKSFLGLNIFGDVPIARSTLEVYPQVLDGILKVQRAKSLASKSLRGVKAQNVRSAYHFHEFEKPSIMIHTTPSEPAQCIH